MVRNIPGMGSFKHYVKRYRGALSRLSETTGKSIGHLSRIADGHTNASLPLALDLANETGLPPSAFAIKPTAKKGDRKSQARVRA